MGVVTAMTQFCYIECDVPDCRKKVHHYGEQILTQMAKLLGWEHRGEKWLCPHCVESTRQGTREGATPVRASEPTGL